MCRLQLLRVSPGISGCSTMVEGDTLTSGPRQVIDISPIDSSSSGKLTTCDCDDFIGGTEGDVTHGLKYYFRF